MQRIIKNIIKIFFISLVLFFFFTQTLIYFGGKDDIINNETKIIILGCKYPSQILQNRVNKTFHIWEKNTKITIIASGGKGDNEHIPEALGIKKELILKGVPKKIIYIEDQSKNTRENLIFSKKYFNKGEKIILVTSDYHLFRAKMLAKRYNITVKGIGVKTPKQVFLKTRFRESFALVKSFLFD